MATAISVERISLWLRVFAILASSLFLLQESTSLNKQPVVPDQPFIEIQSLDSKVRDNAVDKLLNERRNTIKQLLLMADPANAKPIPMKLGLPLFILSANFAQPKPFRCYPKCWLIRSASFSLTILVDMTHPFSKPS